MSVRPIAAELQELDTKRKALVKKRNAAIRTAVRSGTKRSEVAESAGVSAGRVFELTRDLKKPKKEPPSK